MQTRHWREIIITLMYVNLIGFKVGTTRVLAGIWKCIKCKAETSETEL
jgi:hypothetical protein